jgi:ketosteroid isomerase-like protein
MTSISLTDAAALEDVCLGYMAAVNRGPDSVAAMCTEDIVWYDVALKQPLRGREAVRQFLAGMYEAISGLRVVEPDPPHRTISPDGTAVAWEWRTLGTMMTPDGGTREIDLPGVDLWRLRDGLLCEYRGYYDLSVLGMTAS